MGDYVEVPFGENPSDTAVLLLAAAEEHDRDPEVVLTGSGYFLVERDLAKTAGVPFRDDDDQSQAEQE